MKPILRIALAFLLPLGFFLAFTPGAKAACTFGGSFNGDYWISPVISLDEVTQFQIPGNADCANKTVAVDFYGKGGTDFKIGATKIIQATSSGVVSGTIGFTASDFSGKSGNQQVYLKAHAEDGSSNTVTSQVVTVQLPAGTGCQLVPNSAVWITTNWPSVMLQVQGRECPNYGITFTLYNASVPNQPVGSVNATFNAPSGGSLISTAQATVQWNTGILSNLFYGGKYYFSAAAGNSKIQSSQITLPIDAPSNNSGGSGGGSNATGTGSTGTGNTATKSYSFTLFNPLCQGDNSSCPQNIFDIFDIVSTWIVNISIPIAVILILWAGFKMLTSRGVPANVQQGRKIITYVVLGLAIIFIGKGFISLIYSILNLGSGATTDTTTGLNGPNTSGAACSGSAYVLGNQVIGSCANGFAVCVGGQAYSNTGVATGASCSNTCGAGGLCQNGILNDQGTGIKSCTRDSDCTPTSAGAGLGYLCSKNSDCISGLVCDNTLCKRPGGNAIGEACLNTQCAQGLACDNTTTASVQINNRTVGTCYQPLCNQDLHKCINNSNITCNSSADCQ
ncbi:MAG TPA: pilin [Candidatus Paceibacterota bacterium]|nr:pilin [Candidatus Paceibacterota bacterium]